MFGRYAGWAVSAALEYIATTIGTSRPSSSLSRPRGSVSLMPACPLVDGVERRRRRPPSIEYGCELDQLPCRDHARRLIAAAWHAGDREHVDTERIRRWAHQFRFGGACKALGDTSATDPSAQITAIPPKASRPPLDFHRSRIATATVVEFSAVRTPRAPMDAS